MDRLIQLLILLFLSSTSHAAYFDEISVLLSGSTPSANNPMPVRYTNGTNYVELATSANQSTMITSLNTIATNTAKADSVQSGTITGAGQGLTWSAQGFNFFTVSVTGTWVGTMVIEGQYGDSNWVQVPFYVITNISPTGPVNIINSNGLAGIVGGGFTNMRVRSNTWTSGTANVAAVSSYGNNSMYSIQSGTWKMGLVDGSLNNFGTQTNPLMVSQSEKYKDTYSSSVVGLVAGTTPTDIFTITGSATKTIRITRISITGAQTTAAQRDVAIIKRSAANTGGTSTTPAIAPHDSTSPAATAVVRAYTANPSALGASAGTMRARKVFIATATTNSDEFIVDFGDRPSESIVLRGATQLVAINLNGVTSSGNSFTINVEFTEENP